jgi:hypothetical protein
VHAGVVGEWVGSVDDELTIERIVYNGTPITYNPYKYNTFVHLYGEHPISTGRLVALTVNENKRSHINVWN